MGVGALTEVENGPVAEAIEAENCRPFERAFRRPSERCHHRRKQFRPFRLKRTYGQRQPGCPSWRIKIAAACSRMRSFASYGVLATKLLRTGRGPPSPRAKSSNSFRETRKTWARPCACSRRGALYHRSEAAVNKCGQRHGMPGGGIWPGGSIRRHPYALGVSSYPLAPSRFSRLAAQVQDRFSGWRTDGEMRGDGHPRSRAHRAVEDGTKKEISPILPPTRIAGFKVLVGGGLGKFGQRRPRSSMISPEEGAASTHRGVLRVFRKTGNRKNKLMAAIEIRFAPKRHRRFAAWLRRSARCSKAPAENFTVPFSVSAVLVTSRRSL